jgi:hypothetical protein
MQDPRWSQLKQNLLCRGWTWRDNALYAPHETMWFTTSSDPDIVNFRDRMTAAAEAAAGYVEQGNDQTQVVERQELRDDLVSLVAALDEMLEN